MQRHTYKVVTYIGTQANHNTLTKAFGITYDPVRSEVASTISAPGILLPRGSNGADTLTEDGYLMVTGYNRAKLELIINLGPIHFTSDTQPYFLQLKHYTGCLLGEEGL